jgi:putative membrane protein
MIKAHTASEAKLKMTIARIAPTIRLDETTLTAEEQSRLQELQSTSVVAFDLAYIGGQVTAHEDTLQTLEAYAAVGDNATLAQLAKETIPSVRTQLRMARRLL